MPSIESGTSFTYPLVDTVYPFPIPDCVTFTWWISHSTYLESLSNNNKAVFLLPLAKFQLVKLLPLYTPPAWKRCPFRAGLPTVIQTQFPTVYLKHRLAFFFNHFCGFYEFLSSRTAGIRLVCGRKFTKATATTTTSQTNMPGSS